MKVLVPILAILTLGAGVGQLAFDGMALCDVRDIESAFANGDGVWAELNHQELSDALKTHDPAQMAEAVDRRLSDAPFDPFLLSVKAHAMFLSGSENLQISAKQFDQARAIAPSDRRVEALRASWQARLHGTPLPKSPSAE